MAIQQLWQQFLQGMKNTTALEYIAVASGIGSVWFSRIENILVYPVGLVSTVIYIYLSFKFHLLGEATVNFYYTVMSIYGWTLWARRNQSHEHVLKITSANRKEVLQQFAFFGGFYILFYVLLTYAKTSFAEGAIPFGDSFATATAFTGMWLMAKKKVESWYWWIATNIASVPLYFVKGLVFTSVFYFVLLIMAFFGLSEWRRRSKQVNA